MGVRSSSIGRTSVKQMEKALMHNDYLNSLPVASAVSARTSPACDSQVVHCWAQLEVQPTSLMSATDANGDSANIPRANLPRTCTFQANDSHTSSHFATMPTSVAVATAM